MDGFLTTQLLPFLIGIGCLLLSACKSENKSTSLWEMERDKIEISKKIEVLGYRLSLHEPDHLELASLNSKLEQMKAAKKALLADQIRLNSEVAALEADHEKMMVDLIQSRRSEIIGTKIQQLVVADGRTYQDVQITDIGDAGVDFRHEGGSTRLRYNELSQLQRDYFALEDDSANHALAKEQKSHMAYEKWVSKVTAQNREERRSAEANQGQKDQEQRRRSYQLAFQDSRARSSALSRPATPVGRRTWSRVWSYQYPSSYYDTPRVYYPYSYSYPYRYHD
jgi:hypothetical protein